MPRRRRAKPRSSRRSDRRAGVAAVVRRRLLRWHRRPHAGKNRCARPRHQPARHHVDARTARWICSVQDGELRSVNIAKMIRFVAAGTLSGWQENKAEKTDLTQLSAFFRLEGGKASDGQSSAARPAGARDRRRHRRSCGENAAIQGRAEARAQSRRAGRRRSIRSASACRLSCRGPGARRASIRRWPVSWTTPKRPTPSFASWDRDCSGLDPGQSGIAGNALPQSIDALIDRLGGDRKTHDRSGEYRKTTASLADAVAGCKATATAAAAGAGAAAARADATRTIVAVAILLAASVSVARRAYWVFQKSIRPMKHQAKCMLIRAACIEA